MPLNLEHEGLQSYNYLTQLVDADTGFTFFDVFLTDPAEAAHDWPDFLDVPGRSAESCVLLRHMTGQAVKTEEAFFERILAHQRDDGLFHRPETRITRDEVMIGEQALVMAALLARAIGDHDPDAEARLVRLVDGLTSLGIGEGPLPAMLTRPLVRTYEHTGHRPALSLACQIRDRLTEAPPLFREDGSFAGHVHSHLYAAAGLVELGRITGDDVLVQWMDRVFQTIRDRSTAFGFVPELTEREDDVIGCETCCLMDYIHLGLTLTKAGRTEHFDDIERAVRNHLVESRVRHGDWLLSASDPQDEELITRSGLQEKVIGAYAGWSAPGHILAYDEYLPHHWIEDPSLAPIYLHKVRALQNCCGPSGPKALYLAWQHAARIEAGVLRINLLVSRSLPEAEIRGFEPREGKVEVHVKAPLRVALRVPGFAGGERITVQVGGVPVSARREGHYIVTEPILAGTSVVFEYPLPVRSEAVFVGNEGHQQYEYTAHWRGSTVMRLTPGDNAVLGRSFLMEKPVRLYYGAEGPHPLYERDALLTASAGPAELNPTRGPDIW